LRNDYEIDLEKDLQNLDRLVDVPQVFAMYIAKL